MATGKQSLTELRGLCQSMNIKWTFADDANALKQKLQLRQNELLPAPEVPVVPVPDDQRLRVRPPSKVSDEDMIRKMIAPYIERGLHFTVTPDGQFHMRRGEQVDSGTLRQPPRVIVGCAARMFQ